MGMNYVIHSIHGSQLCVEVVAAPGVEAVMWGGMSYTAYMDHSCV